MDLPGWRKRATGGNGPGRLAAVDAARGAAVAAMVVFHARWDLASLGLTGPSRAVGPAWQAFGDGIAAVFLLLSGVSLALADRRGVSLRRKLGRLARLAAVALGITAASRIAAPGLTVTAGMVHCLVMADALMLPLLRAPRRVGLAVAVLLLVLPLVPLPPAWDGPFTAWLGLGSWPVATLDYRPLAPWAAFVPLGAVAARSVPEGSLAAGSRWRVSCWAGRHSLALYLAHQAVLYPLALGATLVLGSTPAMPLWANAFEAQCRTDCEAVGAEAALCRSACACTRDRIETVRGTSSEGRERLPALAQACLKRAGP